MESAAIIFLLSLLVATAVITSGRKDLFSAVLMLGIYSLLSAGLFIVLDAPDVAFTEAAVGAGFSTVLFLAAIAMTTNTRSYTSKRQWLAIALVVPVGCMLLFAMPDLPHFVAQDGPAHQHVAQYYLQQTQQEIGIPNVVTAILASYRGFDTLGELVVIFTAGVGATGIFMGGD